MTKYYVRCGRNRTILCASNPIHASILGLKRFFCKDDDDTEQLIGMTFVVSERGFDKHDDDEVFAAGEIIMLQIMSNAAKEELRKETCKATVSGIDEFFNEYMETEDEDFLGCDS